MDTAGALVKKPFSLAAFAFAVLVLASLAYAPPPAGCGNVGQACCSGSSCNSGSLGCNIGTNTCVSPCGGSGQWCCGSVNCNLGFGCDVRTGSANFHKCIQPCGGISQVCCTDAGGYTCSSGACDLGSDTCQACGGSGQPCCSGSTCDPGLACTRISLSPLVYACQTCGGSGQVCCTGSSCNNLLTCSAITNQCGTTATPPSQVSGLYGALSSLCTGLASLLPTAAMLMIVAGSVIYAAGQIMGAETRARANVWATAALTGALIAMLISVVAPALLQTIYGPTEAITCTGI